MKTRTRSWQESLLSTKFFAPPPRSGRVERPRLTAQLDAAIQRGHKLVLIAAPAGFGKTTIVSDWVMGDVANRTARWLTLDDQDNDATHFLTYLLAALEPLARSGTDWDPLVQRFSDLTPTPPEAILTPVLNDLAPGAGDTTLRLLILDDYHVIHDPTIHQALAFFIERLPPQVHVVITTRIDPPLPLARWLARGEMSQLRADELSFTSNEATHFLNGTMGLHLDPPQITALEMRTEGWIAGLQLAGIALASAGAGGGSQSERERFITAFAGTHRVVLDYLIEEVLQRQSPQLQQFLLQTSILERLSASLCDAVLDAGETARGTLDELERANLFLSPLDAAHEWYRYHPLWMEALRHRYQITRAAQALVGHARASTWYEQNGFITEAVQHAFAAKDTEGAARLVESHAALLIKRGEYTPLREWFARLPDGVYETRPRLGVARVWWLFLTGARQQAGEGLRRAERALAVSGLPEAVAQLLRGEIETLYSAIYLEDGDWEGAMRHSAEARRLIGQADVPTRGLAEMCDALAKFWSGQVQGIDRELEAASQLALASGNLLVAFTAACHQGEVIMMQGRLRDAMAHFRALEARAREWGVQHRPFAALLHVNRGMLYFELNELNATRAAFERAMALSDFGSAPREWLISAAFIAWLDFIQGHRTRALEWVAQGEAHLKKYEIPAWASSHLIDTEQGLEIWDKDYDETRRWLEQSEIAMDAAPDYVNELAQITVARVKTMHHDYDSALVLAERMTVAAEQQQRIGSLPRWYTMQALLYARRGDKDKALEQLHRAIDLGAPRQFVRSIIDEGYTILELLQEMLANPRTGDTAERLAYVERLVAEAHRDLRTAIDPMTFVEAAEPIPAALPPPKAQERQALVEPLSTREIEVLKLVAEGFSNREIADQLVVGVGTVKTHINNIFRKLDAYSRTQALKRAREVGLVP